MKNIICTIKADLSYMIEDIREFGFSWSNFKANLGYMIENITDPTRERR